MSFFRFILGIVSFTFFRVLESPLQTGFAWNSGLIRKKLTFSELQGFNLCTSHILVFWLLRSQVVLGPRKVNSKKRYQEYSESHPAALSHVGKITTAFVPVTARNNWTQAASILVERTVHQNTEVLSFVYFQSNLDHHYLKSWKFPFVASVSGESRF